MDNNGSLRALVIAPTPTWPLNYGNRKRIYSVCSKLKDLGFEIHYVHYASEGDWRNYVPVEARRVMNQQWDFVDHVWPSKPLHDWPKEGEDHKIDEWWDWSLENHLKKTFSAREYDLCIVNYTWLSKALELAPPQTYKVLDTHDKFSGRRQLLAQQGIGKEFFHTTEEQEVLALDRADLVWAIKDEEKNDFISMGTKAKVSTLLHIDERRESASPDYKNGVRFGFIGANNNINKINILRFIERATPIFTKYCAPLTVEIAGSLCSELSDVDNPFFKPKGYVDSVDQFYDGIHASIIPMEFSTGLKIKVAEALSHTKPLLSHKHAMEGFSSCHEMHELESFEEIALAMVELSYESSILRSLKDASEESYKIAEDSILRELHSLKSDIVARKRLFVVLPSEYGDKKCVGHYVAQAKIDLINWNFEDVSFYMIGKALEAKPHEKFIRFMSEEDFEKNVERLHPELIFNLSEEFPLINIPQSVSIVSLTKISHLDEKRYVQYQSYSATASELYFPSVGHVHIENGALERVVEECWIIGALDGDAVNTLLNVTSGSLRKRIIDIKSLKELDLLFKKSQGLPRLIFSTKDENTLNHSEQILLEICEKYDVDLRNAFQSQLLFQKRSNEKGNYEQQFFAAWEKFIKNVFSKSVQAF